MTMQPDAAALTDLIHGALFGESSWQEFLDRARLLMPNGQALLFYHDHEAGHGAFPLSSGGDAALVAAYKAHYCRINPWMPHAAVRPLGRVVQADEMLPRHELHATEYYNEYLKPQGIDTGFGVTIRRDRGCNFLFSVMSADVEDAEAKAIKATFQSIVPHLRHAFDYYRRSPQETGFGPAWNAQPLLPKARGMVRVGPGSRVLFADSRALWLAEQSDCLSLDLHGRLSCTSSAMTDYLATELAAWDGGATPPSARAFHLRRKGDALPLRITVYRPGGDGSVFFLGPECVLLIEDPAAEVDAAVDDFGAMYGLSHAERRVTGGLAAGLTLDAIATRHGTTLGTVRTQLGHIFAKTGLSRQTDLVRHVCVMVGRGALLLNGGDAQNP